MDSEEHVLKQLSWIAFRFAGSDTEMRLMQPENSEPSRVTIPSGITIEASDVQSEKALSLSSRRASGSEIWVNAEQPLKAPDSMLVSRGGRVRLERLVQFLNVLYSISVTPSGMDAEVIDAQS